MPSKKLTKRQAQTRQRDLEVRAQLRVLKDKGLYRGDLRKAKPTAYGKKLVKQFSDVLSGKAAVLKAPKNKDAAVFKDTFRVRYNRIVVPKEKGENVRYDAKKRTIKSSRVRRGKKETVTKAARPVDSIFGLPPERPGRFYRVPFGGGQSFTFETRKELEAFMQPYEEKSRNPYVNWWRFVEIVDLRDIDDDPSGATGKPAFSKRARKSFGK